MMLVRRGPAALAALIVALLPLTACGADQPAVCSSVDDLSISMNHLGELQHREMKRQTDNMVLLTKLIAVMTAANVVLVAATLLD